MAEGMWTEDLAGLATLAGKAWYNSMIYPIATWTFDHPEIFFATTGAMVLGGSALLLRQQRGIWLKKARRMFRLSRGKQMSRKEYQKLQATIAAQLITDVLEDAIVEGKLKASFVNHLYKQMGYIWQNKLFLAQRLTGNQRLSQDEYAIITKALFDKQPANIPGAKPGEVDNVHVYSKDNGVKFKNTGRKFGDKVRRHV